MGGSAIQRYKGLGRWMQSSCGNYNGSNLEPTSVTIEFSWSWSSFLDVNGMKCRQEENLLRKTVYAI
jgi:hypothetical protein